MFGRDAPGLFLCRSAHYLEICFNGFGQSKISASTPRSGAAPARAGLAPMVFEHDSFRRGGQGELYLVQRRKRKKPEDAQRDADREAEVQSLRSRVTELERRLSQLEAENAQLRSRDYSLQLA